jgi:hypothetical protein
MGFKIRYITIVLSLVCFPAFAGQYIYGDLEVQEDITADGAIYANGSGDSIFASDVEFQGAVTIAGVGDTTFTTDVQIDGTLTNPGITVTSGNYVCYNTTSKAFYVKSSCP